MNTDLIELPPNWKWTTLGEIADVVGGGTPKTNDPSNYESGTIPWITPADLSGYTAKHIAHGARFITQKGLEESSAKMMPAGTVMFTSRAPIGYVAIASSPVCTNQGFKSFVLKEGVLPDYVYWWLKGSKDLAESMASGTTFLELSGAKAKQLPIPVAPLDQQKCIVAEIEKQFSRLDEAVANLKRVKANLKRYKAAVLKAAVEGRLVETEAELAAQGRANVAGGTTPGATARQYESGAQLLQRILETRRSQWKGKGKYKEPAAPDTTDLPELPEGWVWASLDQLSWDSSYGTSAKCAYENKGPPVLRIPNVDKAAIDLANVKYAPTDLTVAKEESLSPGDMLVIRTNGSKSLIGRAAVVTTQFQRPTTYASYLIRFRLLGDPVLSAWVLSYWQSHSSRSWIESKAATSAGQHNISMTVLATAPIPLPPADEQDRIVAEVERRLSLLRETETQVNINVQRADRLRQAILTKAFSGLLVTHVARREMGAAS